MADNRVCVLGFWDYSRTTVAVADVRSAAQENWAGISVVTNGMPPTSVWVQGDYAYAACQAEGSLHGHGGLEVLALDSLQSVGRLTTTQSWWGIQVEGVHAYVAAGEAGLRVLDISNPASPREVGGCAIAGFAVSVALAGNCAYVAAYEGGLQVIDVSDPAHPAPVGRVATGLTTRKAQVVNNRAWILSADRHESSDSSVVGKSRVELLDLTDISQPVLLGALETPGLATAMSSSADLVCTLLETNGSSGFALDVVDWSNPARPQRLGWAPAGGYPSDVWLAGDRAYVTGDAGLIVFDLKDPAKPVQVGELPVGDGVQVEGTDVYGTQGREFFVLDWSNPARPIERAWIEIPGTGSLRLAGLAGGYAYLILMDQYWGWIFTQDVNVVDVRDPANPVHAGRCPLHNVYDPVFGLDVADRYAFLAEGSAGVGVLDVSDPTRPFPLAGWSAGGIVHSVQAAGDRVYVGDAGLGLVVLRRRSTELALLTTPESQTVISGRPVSLRVSAAGAGPLAYQWFMGRNGAAAPIPGATAAHYTMPALTETTDVWVRVRNASGFVDSPAAHLRVAPEIKLQRVGEWPGYPLGEPGGMCVVGHYAYVRTRAGGLLVFDLSNPAAPRRVGGCAAPGSVGHPAVLGQYLYLAASDRGLQVFDVSNPASPGQVFACPPIHGASRDVVVSGGRAYVTETRYSEVAPGWLSWLVIYDLQNPASPTLLGNYTGPGLFQDVTLVGGYAYLAERGSNPFDECRLEVIDVNNPAQPRRVWQSEPQGYWGGIAVAGNYACILAEVYRLRQQIPVGTV